MSRSKVHLAKEEIAAQLRGAGERIYRRRELGELLANCRSRGTVAKRLSLDDFIDFLENSRLLATAAIKQPSGSSGDSDASTRRSSTILRYYHGELSPYELGLTLRENSYLSHGSAAFLHGLNDQLPSVIYVNREQGKKPEPSGHLLQANVDRAFAHPQRTSKHVFTLQGTNTSYTLLNGKCTDNYGVVQLQDPMGRAVACTDLERTLVDCVVRPSYAGGVTQIMESFATARDRVSTAKILTTLEALEHFYPYHQAIGFYMSRTGYSDSQIAPLRQISIKIDFYLAHAMKRTDFDASWRIHYPKGL
jgi:hypothetical protein